MTEDNVVRDSHDILLDFHLTSAFHSLPFFSCSLILKASLRWEATKCCLTRRFLAQTFAFWSCSRLLGKHEIIFFDWN